MFINTERPIASPYRWLLICSSFIIMMIISVYQYSWFLFSYAIERQLHWDLATIGLTFTIFAYAATFIQPFSGYVADSYGPRRVAIGASFLVGTGFILSSFTSSPVMFHLFYGLGGLGVGVLYGISTACAVKWFPDRRGFATGLVVFGFGAGTAVFNWLIQGLLDSKGLSATLMVIGFSMIITLIPLSTLYAYPREARSPFIASSKETVKTSSDFRPTEMLGTYQWFLIYFSFAVTVSIVLMFGAQMKMLAREFNIPTGYFSLLLVLFPLGNGISRVFSGAVSDKVGREKTMVIFYSCLGLSILSFVMFGHIPMLFVIIVFIAALLGGAPFALYPATIGDYYGTRYATTNYGITYTAKAWAGLISGWLSGYLVMKFGSYKLPLVVVAIGSLMAAAISNPRLLKVPAKKRPAPIPETIR
jgi:OFA family oxalate/formate antiporter-like MFS transporter